MLLRKQTWRNHFIKLLLTKGARAGTLFMLNKEFKLLRTFLYKISNNLNKYYYIHNIFFCYRNDFFNKLF